MRHTGILIPWTWAGSSAGLVSLAEGRTREGKVGRCDEMKSSHKSTIRKILVWLKKAVRAGLDQNVRETNSLP